MKGKRLQMAQAVREEARMEFALDELARLAETTAEMVRQYCEMGLLGEGVRSSGAQTKFGEGSLFLVRRIEQLRLEYGVPAEGAELVLDLAARVEELEGEIRSLREALGR
ncbi:MAG: hypothetical protein NTZ01_04885 [Verrucomicrobia bacterium]|nr:hypothetical protein [Verrucomicrobiota bacterium]